MLNFTEWVVAGRVRINMSTVFQALFDLAVYIKRKGNL